MTANCGDQIERRETGVGDDHDLAIWHRFNAAVSFRQMMGEAPLQAKPLPEKNPARPLAPSSPSRKRAMPVSTLGNAVLSPIWSNATQRARAVPRT